MTTGQQLQNDHSAEWSTPPSATYVASRFWQPEMSPHVTSSGSVVQRLSKAPTQLLVEATGGDITIHRSSLMVLVSSGNSRMRLGLSRSIDVDCQLSLDRREYKTQPPSSCCVVAGFRKRSLGTFIFKPKRSLRKQRREAEKGYWLAYGWRCSTWKAPSEVSRVWLLHLCPLFALSRLT